MAVIEIFAPLVPADEGDLIIDASAVANTNALTLGDSVGAALETLEAGLLDVQGSPDEIELPFATGVFTARLADAVKIKKLRGALAAPTVNTTGTGAGTGGVVTVDGDGLCFEIKVVAGSAAAVGASTVIGAFTHATAFANPPKIVLTPSNRAAWARQSAAASCVSIENIGLVNFSLNAGSTSGLTQGVTYTWQCQVYGK